jgi:hypothetical protein
MNTDRLHRQAELAAFYTAHRGALERILRRRVRTSEAVIEDACQTPGRSSAPTPTSPCTSTRRWDG